MADELLRALSHKMRMEPVSRFVAKAVHDPDGCAACAVDALLAERDSLRETLGIADAAAGREHTNRVLAEARVKALEQALETLATADDFVDEEDYQAFARAALAALDGTPE